ncbi:hypothetical protein BGC07_01240, partial [Piscirickettsia litoralis]
MTLKNDGISKIKDLLDSYDIEHIPVLDKDKLVGIISLKDILKISFTEKSNVAKEDKDNTLLGLVYKIKDIMKDPITIKADASIADACSLMVKHKIHALLIINSKNKLTGIVTTTDILKYITNDN